MDILQKYKEYSETYSHTFILNDRVNPYDKSTLFCPAGMQQFKDKFKDIDVVGTITNSQSCIRMNDFHEIGDSTHLLYFNMLGLFSFRQFSVTDAISFWLGFLIELDLELTYVTVHPDKLNDEEWVSYYHYLGIDVVSDEECTWTDGDIGGYCTEFFINDKNGNPVEIGNIVNPLGDCIDCGFGLERLEMFVNGKTIDKETTLKETILKIIESGYKPSATKQGYVLRKLLRELFLMGGTIDHDYFVKEIDRQERNKSRYLKLREKYSDKPSEWWWDTQGIDIKLYENL